MNADVLIDSAARAVTSLAPSLRGLEDAEAEIDDTRRAAARGHFTPAEDERVHAWFARYLTARAGLLEVIDDLQPIALAEVKDVDERARLRCFLLAYTAACVLVRAARFLVAEFATHKVIQRKLNEAEPRFRIARKQYTAIYRSVTSPRHAWRLREAIAFADESRAAMLALADDPRMAPVVEHLRDTEDSLRLSVGQYVKARLRFRWHSYRRRRASAAQQVLFGIAEAFGRVIADIRSPWGHSKRVNEEVRAQLAALLEPGDVLITRHDDAVTNLFLPGYWPHAMLYIGPPSTCDCLAVTLDRERAARWIDPLHVLEARKDGVLFRPLADSLAVDAVAVIRPRLTPPEVAQALTGAISHEGKLYDFDFDFFRADRLVCTEVVYRALDGVGPIRFELKRRAGRPTLSAEDLLDMAVDDRGFLAVAVFGAENCRASLVTGADAASALAESYRARKS